MRVPPSHTHANPNLTLTSTEALTLTPTSTLARRWRCRRRSDAPREYRPAHRRLPGGVQPYDTRTHPSAPSHAFARLGTGPGGRHQGPACSPVRRRGLRQQEEHRAAAGRSARHCRGTRVAARGRCEHHLQECRRAARRRPRARRGAPERARPMWETRPVWPASQNTSANQQNWPRLAEAGSRPELDLALAGRAGGRFGQSLWATVSHAGARPAHGARPQLGWRAASRVPMPAV